MMRRSSALVIAVIVFIAVCVTGILILRKEEERRAINIFDEKFKGMITYQCSGRSGPADFDPRTIGPSELFLILRKQEGDLMNWTVREPGHAPVHASTFAVNTGSIGGSQGLRWLTPGGELITATLSFSDVIGRYGPETIWVQMSRTDNRHDGVGNKPIDNKLTCGPDPASHLND
jgi:hypothetical protein